MYPADCEREGVVVYIRSVAYRDWLKFYIYIS